MIRIKQLIEKEKLLLASSNLTLQSHFVMHSLVVGTLKNAIPKDFLLLLLPFEWLLFTTFRLSKFSSKQEAKESLLLILDPTTILLLLVSTF